MNFDSASAHKAAAHRPGHPTRRIVFAAAVVAAALFALFSPAAQSDQRADTVVASTAVPSAPAVAPHPAETPRSPSSTQGHGSRFFGFLEFDWDPNAPGGVPGFDPWPATQQRQ
jgi:hypothetical protein